jgi:phospholipase/carboxylesterase
VSLRAPRSYHGGYAWFHIAWRDDGSMTPDVGQARETLGDLVRWLAAAPPRLGVDPKRVYLLGFSQGAMMSLGVLRTAPERVAGIVALSGFFDDALFAGPAPDDAAARVAVFVGHGTQDALLPVADGRAVRAFFEPRVRDFTYREYPIAHAIGPAEIRDVAAWLAARLAATGAP